MSNYNEYLSDEELNKLITEIEEEGEKVAPCSIEESVLAYVDKRNNKKSEKISYYIYCAKVVASMAAAVFILVILPVVKGNNPNVPAKEDVVVQDASLSKEELFTKEDTSQKEEVLNRPTGRERIEKLQSELHSKIEELYQ